MKVRDVMSHEVRCCTNDSTLNDAARIMWEKDVGFLPVVDCDGFVVGVITDRDVCMAAYTQGVSLSEGLVVSAMSKNVVSARPDESIRSVETKMRDKHLRRLPVLDESGQPLGVVTLADLARHGEATAFRKTLQAPAIVKTLAAISEPRREALAAE